MTATARKCIGCKGTIAARYVTCEACWWALPMEMRARFSARREAERTAVLIEMVHWFADGKEAAS